MSERINHPPGEHPKWCDLNHKPDHAHGKLLASITSNGLTADVRLVGDLDILTDTSGTRAVLLVEDEGDDGRAYKERFDLAPDWVFTLGAILAAFDDTHIAQLGAALQDAGIALGAAT